jgi:hypothetical protein
VSADTGPVGRDVTSALRRQASMIGVAALSDLTSTDTIHRCVFNCWDRHKKPKSTAKEQFEQLVAAGPPRNAAMGAARVEELRPILLSLSKQEQHDIMADRDLMTRAWVYVGPTEYMSLICAIRMYAKALRRDGSTVALHMTAVEASAFIQRGMRAIDHLWPYLSGRINAGCRVVGYFAVVDKINWDRVFSAQYPYAPIGSADEQSVSAFTSFTHADPLIVVRNCRGTRSTAIHECMHLYAMTTIMDEWGSGLNEAVTEYFTRLVADRDGNPARPGSAPRENYQAGWEFVQHCILPLLGANIIQQQTALAEMAFKGHVGLLHSGFRRACTRRGFAEADITQRSRRFEVAVKAGQWADAVGALV